MPDFQYKKKLSSSFYLNDALLVAQKLLGKILVKKDKGVIYAGRIVETEAYKEMSDEAAHSYKGKTDRNKIMFEKGGYLYVYFTYGVHFCCNVVTGNKGNGDAVLIRAIEPILGIEQMAFNRYKRKHEKTKELYNLTSGPGKICMAFNINRNHNGIDLRGEKIFIADAVTNEKIITTTRIGIKKSVDLPWRFYLDNNPFVSRL